MRPCKPRRIGVLPSCRRYGPQGGVPEGENRIGLDMLEALRLVDAEGMRFEGNFTDNEKDGPFVLKDNDGRIVPKGEYSHGVIVKKEE